MQAVARWTNLSETTFVLTPDDPAADYRVRIFTTQDEFPFAGHPTLGTAFAVLQAGLPPKTPGRLVQQCGVGLVPIRIEDDGGLAFSAPDATLTPLDGALQPLLARALGKAAVGFAASTDGGRAMAIEHGILIEDPVTGRANACIARLLASSRQGKAYRARQGTALGRAGHITVSYQDGIPWIGGHVVKVIDGETRLPA